MKGVLVPLAFVIGLHVPAPLLAQDQESAVEGEQSSHDLDDPFLDVKLKLDDFVSEWWAVGLNYDCDRSRRKLQEASFNRRFGKRINAAFEKVRSFGPNVAKHSHDVIAIGRCWRSPKGGGSLPANAKQFSESLKSFGNFLAQRKAN